MPQYQIVKYGDRFSIMRNTLLNTFAYAILYDNLASARKVIVNWQENSCVDENLANWQEFNVVWEG